jgi:hypothetical protein
VYVVYCLLQITDGCLTYIGVSRLGAPLEANPMIRAGFGVFGVGLTILSVKFGALMVPLALPPDAKRAWKMLWFVNLLYLTIAVAPWVWVLFLQ